MKKAKKAFQSCIIIVNPTRYPKAVRKLKKLLKHYKAPKVIITKSKEHFMESVRDFYHNSDYTNLLVWGGDGTANDAINGIIEEKKKDETVRKKAIGFLRGGSGNGIQSSYEVPIRLEKQVEAYSESMIKGYTIDTDIIKVKTKGQVKYGQLVGLGFDTLVLDRRNNNHYWIGKRKGEIRKGFFNYAQAFVRSFLIEKNFFSHYHLKLFDGCYVYFGNNVNSEYCFKTLIRNIRTPMIEVGIRPYYGSLFKVCPYVVCNDGYIDVYVFGFQTKVSILYNFLDLYRGKFFRINRRFARKELPIIENYKVKEIKIESFEPFHYHIDGELYTADQLKDKKFRLELKVLPRSLTFLVPPAFYRKFYPFNT